MKILLAVDPSPTAQVVIDAVTERPWPANSYFEIVSVAEPSHLWTTSEAVLEAQRQTQAVVARAVEQVSGKGKEVAGSVFSGDPKSVIIDRARALGADFLMVGSRGASAVPRMLFGSVATTVLRHAPCSVEIIRGCEGRRPAEKWRILLATDGSTFSEKAAKSIAQRPWPQGTEVRILSIVELILPTAHALFEIPQVDTEFLERARGEAMQRAQDAIAAAREILAPSGLPVDDSISVLVDAPKQIILQEGKQWGANLIALGSHGYHGLDRFLMGSVSETVAMHAECCVEVIR